MHCLGLSWLSDCAYNPQAPATVYFTIGDGVAALSLLLLIPQFVKPLYEFRMSMRRMNRTWLYVVATISFLLLLIAAVVPQTPFAGATVVGWPIFWELVAGGGFLYCYSVLAVSYLLPAKVTQGTAEPFARGTARFLAHASSADHTDYARELKHNIKPLLRIAQSVDFKEAEKNAFYAFAKRKQIHAAGYSASLLNILADPAFCRSLIERCPWDVADILFHVSEQDDGISLRLGSELVQQLARQALISNESIVSRETGYAGFGQAPVLSNALFGNWRINRENIPFAGLQYDDFDGSIAQVARLNFVANISLKNSLDSEGAWEATNISHLVGYYETVFRKAQIAKTEAQAWRLCGEVGSGVKDLIEQTRSYLALLPPEKRQMFYVKGEHKPWRDRHVVSSIARLTIEYWNSISHAFQGPSDSNWTSALDTWDACFDRCGSQHQGMDPLQQRVALQMSETIEENMEGLYPPLTRLCISMVGPYVVQADPTSGTATDLIARDLYYRLKTKLPGLAKAKPDRFRDFLPSNVSLEKDNEVLIYAYSSGKPATIELAKLNIKPVSYELNTVNICPSTTAKTEHSDPTAAETPNKTQIDTKI